MHQNSIPFSLYNLWNSMVKLLVGNNHDFAFQDTIWIILYFWWYHILIYFHIGFIFQPCWWLLGRNFGFYSSVVIHLHLCGEKIFYQWKYTRKIFGQMYSTSFRGDEMFSMASTLQAVKQLYFTLKLKCKFTAYSKKNKKNISRFYFMSWQAILGNCCAVRAKFCGDSRF